MIFLEKNSFETNSLIGGLIIFIIIFLNYLIFKNINFMFGLSTIYFIVGLIDDAKKISAILRLIILYSNFYIFNFFRRV